MVELIEAKGIDVEAVLHSHFCDEVSDSSGIVEVVRVQDASCQLVLHRLERVFGLFEAVDDLRDPGVNVLGFQALFQNPGPSPRFWCRGDLRSF
jgi:hypothetical protein